jgi:CDP-2,3-bis-(O-geranylgeranyl)-sn-glycerol synthase
MINTVPDAGLSGILLLILQSAYFLIPAYFANMLPPIAKKFKIFEFLNIPVDFGKKFRDGKPLFGKNKTYRGFLVGIIGGVIGAYLQMFLYKFSFFQIISIHGIAYTNHQTIILLGVLLGFGAIAGDVIESFFKRRLNVDSGASMAPWDQIDLAIGAYLFVFPFVYIFLSWQLFLSSIIITFFLTVIVNHISFYLHIRNERW